MYELLESDEKWLSYTCLKSIESAKLILRKIEFKFFEGSKAKSPSNIASFPPVLFLITITMLIITV